MNALNNETKNEPTRKDMAEIETEFKDVLNEKFEEPKKINIMDILTEDDLIIIEKMMQVLNRKPSSLNEEPNHQKSVKELDFDSFSF